MIRAAVLIAKFYDSLGWGYIYGCTHEMWSEAKQREYEHKYSDDPDRQNSCKYGGKWVGRWVTDCSGLFHYWVSQLGGKIAHGSNSIWDNYCTDKGELRNGSRTDGKPLIPGTAVFTSSGERHNHIGLYVGGGLVIEAQGAQAGVVTSVVTNKKWTHWGELKGVSYEEGGEKTMTATVVLPAGKSGRTVNMREKPSTSSPIEKQVPVGSEVDLYEDQGQWCRIGYKGQTGYMMSDYLEYGQQDETGGADLTPEELEKIEKSLSGIEQALQAIAEWTDDIGRIVGRG